MNSNLQVKGIYFENSGQSGKYTIAVLKCLSNLSVIKEFYLSNEIEALNKKKKLEKTKLLKAFRNLIHELYRTNLKEVDSYKLLEELSQYDKYFEETEKGKINDCQKFLNELLNYLDKELKNLKQELDEEECREVEEKIINKTDKKSMLNYFYNTKLKKNNDFYSFFPNNISSVIKQRLQCTNCQTITYEFKFKNIFDFNITRFETLKKGEGDNSILNIYDCFKYNNNGNQYSDIKCGKCESNDGNIWEQIYSPNNVLVINFSREEYIPDNFDVEYYNKINLKNYINLYEEEKLENNLAPFSFQLKAVLGFDGKDYFSYCYITDSKNQGNWFYFINERCKQLEKDEELVKFKTFKPILLFYENEIINEAYSIKNPISKIIEDKNSNNNNLKNIINQNNINTNYINN